MLWVSSETSAKMCNYSLLRYQTKPYKNDLLSVSALKLDWRLFMRHALLSYTPLVILVWFEYFPLLALKFCPKPDPHKLSGAGSHCVAFYALESLPSGKLHTITKLLSS